MSIITEQDQNSIYDLYQEGILTRARAGLGSFIGGGGVEGKLNNIIAQYKTKIGKELGDLEADFKTFKGSIQPAQQAKLNTLLTNLGSVGVQSAQSMLGKFGHMIGRVVGSAAPAAAVGAATAALGGAPALVGAAAGLTRGMRNVPRTDITGFDKLGRVAASTGIGALAGYGAGKFNDYMSGAGSPGAPGASPEAMPMISTSKGDAANIFKQLHGGAYDPKSSVDAAKMALQQVGQEQGLTGKALQNFVYNNGGSTSMDGNIARETLQRLGMSMKEVNSGLSSPIQGVAPSIPSSAPTGATPSAPTLPTSLRPQFNELGVNTAGMPDIRDIARPSLEEMLDQLKDRSPEIYNKVLDRIENINMSDPDQAIRTAERFARAGLNSVQVGRLGEITDQATGLTRGLQGIPSGD